MKRRNDFVSNSSSSSFIIQNCDLIDYFNITKKDIVDSIKHLLGNCEYKDCFYVYDLKDKKDKEKAIKKWGDLLSQWQCDETTMDSDGTLIGGGSAKIMIGHYNSLCHALKEIYDIENFYDNKFDPEDGEPKKWIRTREKQKNGCYGYEAPLEKFVVDTINDARKRCGIISNLDVLKHDTARWFIHFDDNVIWDIKDACMAGKDDEKPEPNENGKLSDYDKKLIKEINNSIYTTESYTLDRIMEILINYWTSIGKIKVDDPKFIEDLVKHHRIREGESYTYENLLDDVLTFNGHEG